MQERQTRASQADRLMHTCELIHTGWRGEGKRGAVEMKGQWPEGSWCCVVPKGIKPCSLPVVCSAIRAAKISQDSPRLWQTEPIALKARDFPKRVYREVLLGLVLLFVDSYEALRHRQARRPAGHRCHERGGLQLQVTLHNEAVEKLHS